MNKYLRLLLPLLCFTRALSAQDSDRELSTLIAQKDSLFWHAYNTCDMLTMMSFFSADVEFYHDKGGITLGTADLESSFEKGVCSNRDSFTLRREAVDGSVKVFPLRKAGLLYGAIISGEHTFNVKYKGKKEQAEGLARFTHVWLLKDGSWKMTRVLSYDHRPAPYINKRNVSPLSAAVLKTYTGKYQGSATKDMRINAENATLQMVIGGKRFVLYPERENFFFSKERDLTFEFIKQGKAIKKLIVRERDEVAEELNFVSK